MTAEDPLKARTRKILRVLARLYPDAHCALDFRNPLELLIATILSAQCTDVRVNMVTPALFERYRDAAAYAAADTKELETAIQSTGFFRNKARSILACCKALVEKHGGQVPGTLEELIPLAGVGRKTANVILGNCFGVPAVVVDTHVKRVTRRLGLVDTDDPEKIEVALQRLLPKDVWTRASHQLLLHGRHICQARAPKCHECRLYDLCPWEGKRPA